MNVIYNKVIFDKYIREFFHNTDMISKDFDCKWFIKINSTKIHFWYNNLKMFILYS